MTQKYSLWLVCLVALYFTHAQCASAEDCGDPLHSYRGVVSYSNAPYMGKGTACGGESPADLSPYGYKWQCVEFVRRFHATNDGPNLWNAANTWPTYGYAYLYFQHAEDLGLEAIPNGDTRSPQPDDILVFDRAISIGDSYGHIAIVSAVTDSTVTVVEQNDSSSGQKVLSRDLTKPGYWISQRGSYPILGWLRKPTIELDFGAWAPFSFITDDPLDDTPGPGTSNTTIAGAAAGGNPGSYLSVSFSLAAGDTIWGGAVKADFTYDPSSSGPIGSISASADVQMPTVGASAIALVVQQRGTRYYSVPFQTFTGSGWSPITFSNLKATDFDTNPWALSGLTRDGNQPDFSASGATMQFGFVMGNAFRSSGRVTVLHGLDNASFTISPPPSDICVLFPFLCGTIHEE